MKSKLSHPKVKKNNVLKKMFGTFKFKKPVEKLMKEIDDELYDI